MRRRRGNHKRRAKRTVVPAFDPANLAREIEEESSRDTLTPPFDPAAYAMIVEGRVPLGSVGVPRAMATTAAPPSRDSTRLPVATPEDAEQLGRAMYSRYLASDFPAALSLAERVLEECPSDPVAALIVERCRERFEKPPTAVVHPSSILRLRDGHLDRCQHIDPTSSFVLGHVDGISCAGTVAALTGLPPPEALERLHTLVELGILEVVSG